MEPGGGIAPDNASKGQPDGAAQPPGNNGSPVNNGEGNTTGDEPGNGAGISSSAGNNTDSGKIPAVNAAGPSAEGPTVMLSSGMKVTSTVLKVAVDDLTGARAKAVALAAGAGAETQVFPEQSGGKKIVVVRLTTTSNQAAGLMSGLARVGTLEDRQDDSKDITAIYNETLVQYRDLQTRISSARDAGERSQLEAQAASYKQQLDAWEAEAGKRVIMLWLESR
jgi:hypothetical protein